MGNAIFYVFFFLRKFVLIINILVTRQNIVVGIDTGLIINYVINNGGIFNFFLNFLNY